MPGPAAFGAPAPAQSLLLATGHGTLGRTVAASTGRVTINFVSGRRPKIDVSGLAMRRYN